MDASREKKAQSQFLSLIQFFVFPLHSFIRFPRIVPLCVSHICTCMLSFFSQCFHMAFLMQLRIYEIEFFSGARFDFRHFQYRPRIRTHRAFKHKFIYTHGWLSCFVCHVRWRWWWWCWRYCMILMICNLSAYFLNRFECHAILIHWVDSYKIYNDVRVFPASAFCASAHAPKTHPKSDKRKQINLWLCHIVWL